MPAIGPLRPISATTDRTATAVTKGGPAPRREAGPLRACADRRSEKEAEHDDIVDGVEYILDQVEDVLDEVHDAQQGQDLDRTER